MRTVNVAVVLGFLLACASASATCTDPWIDSAFQDLYGIPPSGYGSGHWTTFEDLKGKIQSYQATQTSTSGSALQRTAIFDANAARADQGTRRQARNAGQEPGGSFSISGNVAGTIEQVAVLPIQEGVFFGYRLPRSWDDTSNQVRPQPTFRPTNQYNSYLYFINPTNRPMTNVSFFVGRRITPTAAIETFANIVLNLPPKARVNLRMSAANPVGKWEYFDSGDMMKYGIIVCQGITGSDIVGANWYTAYTRLAAMPGTSVDAPCWPRETRDIAQIPVPAAVLAERARQEAARAAQNPPRVFYPPAPPAQPRPTNQSFYVTGRYYCVDSSNGSDRGSCDIRTFAASCDAARAAQASDIRNRGGDPCRSCTAGVTDNTKRQSGRFEWIHEGPCR